MFHMFVLGDGGFTTIDYPGATATGAATIGVGINPKGEVVGQYRDSANITHGFVLDASGFSTVDIPGYPTTVLTGVNAEGDIVGRARGTDGRDVGFVIKR
jgi:hypothetical protein